MTATPIAASGLAQLLRLASPMLPVGAYAYSQAMEVDLIIILNRNLRGNLGRAIVSRQCRDSGCSQECQANQRPQPSGSMIVLSLIYFVCFHFVFVCGADAPVCCACVFMFEKRSTSSRRTVGPKSLLE